MTKSATTQLAQTGIKPTDTESDLHTLNGAFTFRGPQAAQVAEAFYAWVDFISEDYDVVCLGNRVDFSGHWPTNRLIDKKDVDDVSKK